MRIINLFMIATLLISLISCQQQTNPEAMKEIIDEQMDFAAHQYKKLNKLAAEDSVKVPRNNINGKVTLVKPADWTSGFYPGILWFLAEYHNDPFWQKAAKEQTAKLKDQKENIYTHDLGFMLYCSYGNGYHLTNDSSYADILMEGAYSLISRYNDTVGLIRSWDHGEWEYPVIIDNMMNLEYLFWAFDYSGDSVFYNIALNHADKTLENHFREDYSSYHVLDYDPLSGEILSKGTHQGASDESAWARGQAWGLYGYVMMYRETKNKRYLTLAKNIAEYMLYHENMPDDLIPYWDFNRPGEERDVSAASITASALLELQKYTTDALSKNFTGYAETIIQNLSNPPYNNKNKEDTYFLLNSSVGAKPDNSEVGIPIIYADYYFLEALLRYQDWILEENE